MSARVNSDSVSGGPSGVEAEIGAFAPLVGVGAFPDWSGDAALGVATGVDEVCTLNTLMGINRAEGSRNKSGVGLICSTTSSNGIRLVLLRCSARSVHANVVSNIKFQEIVIILTVKLILINRVGIHKNDSPPCLNPVQNSLRCAPYLVPHVRDAASGN